MLKKGFHSILINVFRYINILNFIPFSIVTCPTVSGFISISRAAFGTFDSCPFLRFSACLLPMLPMLAMQPQLQLLETMPRPKHKGMNRNNNNNRPETESNAVATATPATAARIFQCSQMRIEAPTSAANDSALWHIDPPPHPQHHFPCYTATTAARLASVARICEARSLCILFNAFVIKCKMVKKCKQQQLGGAGADGGWEKSHTEGSLIA